jgi:hypothetical protein
MYNHQIGNLFISGGIKKTPGIAKCPICGQSIKKGDISFILHPIGEYPKQFHRACLNVFIEELEGLKTYFDSTYGEAACLKTTS